MYATPLDPAIVNVTNNINITNIQTVDGAPSNILSMCVPATFFIEFRARGLMLKSCLGIVSLVDSGLCWGLYGILFGQLCAYPPSALPSARASEPALTYASADLYHQTFPYDKFLDQTDWYAHSTVSLTHSTISCLCRTLSPMPCSCAITVLCAAAMLSCTHTTLLCRCHCLMPQHCCHEPWCHPCLSLPPLLTPATLARPRHPLSSPLPSLIPAALSHPRRSLSCPSHPRSPLCHHLELPPLSQAPAPSSRTPATLVLTPTVV
ncbi:hypothetical protein EVG20_g10264 [Dentipellis fragilis]|uniref:Uncharacterized protein n=1 Tax=Dentipellis fragilis TaxID=205917 RepID=A0A4Y9XUQ4_9AGAM|nr:hypothetical protein EVG20_g10264 [Dentipellis fragilis]